MGNFNITTFTSAPWYAQVGQPVIYLTKNELYCVVANYTLTGPTSVGVYNYANVGEVNGPVHDGNICAVVPDTTEPAKLVLSILAGLLASSFSHYFLFTGVGVAHQRQ